MSNFVLDEIKSASYDDEGFIDFVVTGSMNGTKFDYIVHRYRPKMQDATNLACRAWLENNTPAIYQEPDFVAIAKVKEEKNRRLAECDWRMVIDYEGNDQEAWREYRQKLRKIKEQDGYPHNIEWPETP